KLRFENLYIKNPVRFEDRNIHRQISPGVFVYIESYNNVDNTGYRFSMEKIENGTRIFFINSEKIQWDSTTNKWRIEKYYKRTFDGTRETLSGGFRLDTTLSMSPSDFKRRMNIIEAMDTPNLNLFIKQEEMEGIAN